MLKRQGVKILVSRHSPFWMINFGWIESLALVNTALDIGGWKRRGCTARGWLGLEILSSAMAVIEKSMRRICIESSAGGRPGLVSIEYSRRWIML